MKLLVIKYWLTLISAVLILFGATIVLFAAAYMNKGHPPASGYIALIVVLGITPFSILSLLISVFGETDFSGHKLKIYYMALGIHILYVCFISQVWLYKSMLGRTI